VNGFKREQVNNLRKAGLTYAEIGRKVSLTRERVRQIVTGGSTLRKKQPGNGPDSLLTPRQAADLLNVHVNTLRHWSNKGILETYRIGPRGDRRLRRQDIDNLLLKKPANDVS
jgi:excisionase family DNA binding protein